MQIKQEAYLVDGDVVVAALAEVEDEAGDKGVGLSDLKEARISATLKSHNHLVGTCVLALDIYLTSWGF